MKPILLLAIAVFATSVGFAQRGAITGRVFDEISNEPIPFANVAIQNTDIGASTDIDGNYRIENIEPGLYNVQSSYVGYETKTIFEIEVFASQPTELNIGLKAKSTDLEAVEIRSEVFERDEESPVSLQSIGTNEIQRNPGGNRDISRALQVLPGVSSSLSFRNDIIIRGGAPNENRFYLDGIEVPVINHFATQGSSGGPVGIINVNFIKSVDFYSGAFPANRGNTLSSVLEFTQKDGNSERLKTNLTIGSSDVGLTFDGSLGEKTSYIFSARRSYLQLLFGVLGLPFLPTYNDSQFKVKHRFNSKNEITFVGLGAYDTFELNEEAVAKADTEEDRREAEYTLNNIPSNEQWNYTVGANYKHFSKNGFQNVVVSRNHLNNTAVKYENNDESNADGLILDYGSEEIENKFRFEHTMRTNGWKINAGLNLEDATYRNSTFNRIPTLDSVETISFSSELNFQRFGVFGQLSRSFFEDRLLLSFGFRSDWNNYSDEMNNPIDQFSPRFSLSYSIAPGFTFNGNIGRYYQLPPYTVLGFRNQAGSLTNRNNGVTYIQNDQYVAGFQYVFKKNTKVSVEGFYKKYSNYPFTLRDSINLANLGADFGVIGNEPVRSIGEGRAYGVEFLVQRKLFKGGNWRAR
ncbi:MAG: TonB-dependent receptor [Flavobacteriales bacterium]|nr:TonB-dependent receptor [Flavobacteriales bacterium]